jgi:hypothetical protein
MTSKQIISNTMTATIKTLAAGALLAMVAGVMSPPILARDYQGHQAHHTDASGQDVIIGRKGVLHFTKPVKAGESLLPPGMYIVQHLNEGQDHVIAFKKVVMDASGRIAKPMPGKDAAGEEVARIKCRVEPTGKKWSDTRVILRDSAAGGKEIAEVRVAGEAFKHLM